MKFSMKISWLKYEKDKDSFKMPEALGLDVYKLHDLEDSDKMLEKLINEDYKTIIISNDVACFSENIIKIYDKNPNINIVISIDKDIL